MILSFILSFLFAFELPPFLNEVYGEAEVNGHIVKTSELRVSRARKINGTDEIGAYSGVDFVYKYKADKAEIHHVFAERDGYWTVSLTLRSKKGVSSSYLAPVCLKDAGMIDNCDSSSRVLRVPFDNDDFVVYKSSRFPVRDISFEVTALFNGMSRNGVVVGSVDHDKWKSAVAYDIASDGTVKRLRCYCGAVHKLTRDVKTKRGHTTARHGKISGTEVSSSRIFVGSFADWRRGLETYGECNAAVHPKRGWQGGTPRGWNSWASMATKVNYKGICDVSDFVADSLRYTNEGDIVYIGIDSFWDRMTDDQLHEFVLRCHENGQKAGIYWCPFSDWIGRGDAYVEGTDRKWKYDDIYLRVGSRRTGVESLAVDPTHEGTKMRMEYYVRRFKRLGFEYIKLDFINNGTMEADSFFNPEVTTGVQAYNEGMAYLDSLCGPEMFIALSIAPVFPAGYGNSRRISCDTWGAMKEYGYGTTGYMLNSLSFGWWLDRVYDFNDPDHILFYKADEADFYGDGANRARYTSAVITGLVMLGDNMSSSGEVPGNFEAKRKVMDFTSNARINELADGRSFYPVEGWTASSESGPERFFMRDDGDDIVLAVFNFRTDSTENGVVGFDRLGLAAETPHRIVELWGGETIEPAATGVPYDVAPMDVRVYRITR